MAAPVCLNVSNVVMAGHGEARDFYSTNANGGTAEIVESGLSVETASVPWFGSIDPFTPRLTVVR